MISLSDIRLIYVREIRMALRERHIVYYVVLLPIFMYPIMIWLMYTGMSFVIGQTEGFSSRIMMQQTAEAGREIETRIRAETRIKLMVVEDPLSAIKSGDLDLFIEIEPNPNFKDNVRLKFAYDSSKDRSRLAKDRLDNLITTFRSGYLESVGIDHGLTHAAYQKIWVLQKNVASQRDMGRFILGLMVPMLLIVMVAMGGMFPALDATAGERERSTWETMLSTATHRINILTAKYAYVVTLSAMAGMLNFLAVTISMRSVMAPLLGDRVDDISFSIPFSAIPLILLVTILLAMMVSAFMMIMAAFAKTFKEAQSMVSPFVTLMVIPGGVLTAFPDIEFTTGLAAIPIVNICLLFRESIAGIYHWPQIGITVFTEFIGIGLMLWLATTILKYEDVMAGSFEGSFGKFLKQRMIRKGVRKDMDK